MESFEVIIKDETFRVIRDSHDNCTFSVFNHATCHIVRKNDFGIWKKVEHRFGADNLPIDEIGEAIEKHYREKLQVCNEQVPMFGNLGSR